ncbi:sigma-54-dependent Fis family transcriptional regulator [Candidatus Dependentiae bacterium]|nr:sigma-54-dependent Fis family transcriptional regulator [Candidatus Dependentiae bacterium]
MEKVKILIADDEIKILAMLKKYLSKLGFEILISENGKHAYEVYKESNPDIIISDLEMPILNGLELLKKIRREDKIVQFIFITAFASTDSAIEALKLGAVDYVIKPFKLEEIKIIIERILEREKLVKENKNLKHEVLKNYALNSFIGKSKNVEKLKTKLMKILNTNSTILITGESGTGKELAAKIIHYNSNRAACPFISVNCAAIPEPLIESELFGIEKNIATGVNARLGKFEIADGGTLFLDEIGDMPIFLQVKILRLLQEKEFERVGGLKTVKKDVRIIAATNKNLEEEIKSGNFREDLFYRLNVFPINIPPLRERAEDILMIAEMAIFKLSGLKDLLEDSVKKVLINYNWPGNVRELQNILEYSLIMSERKIIKLEHLPDKIKGKTVTESTGKHISLPESGLKFNDLEKDLLIQALNKAKGNKAKAARLLGISRRTLIYRLKKFNIK